MKKLTVLYDGSCGFCRRCRRWLEDQAKYLDLEFVAQKSPQVARRFPGLLSPGEAEELVVVSDEGGVYRGATAWIMCLYALEAYREWSLALSAPPLLPFARRAFDLLSRSRWTLSRWLGPEDAEACMQEALHCEVPLDETFPCRGTDTRSRRAGDL